MAARYWVGGTASWDTTAGTKWSTTSGGTGGSAVPTAADDVFFDAASGSVTVTPTNNRVARSINCTGFTGTFQHNAAVGITLGDATAGAGNVALLLSATMTYTAAGTNSLFTLASTSATQQTITTNGHTLGQITLNGVGSSYIQTDALTGIGNFTITNGGWSQGGFSTTSLILTSNNSNVRTLVHNGIWTVTSTAATSVWLLGTTNLTYTGDLGTIKIGTASANTRTVQQANLVTGTLDYTVNGSTGQLTIASTATYYTINFYDPSNPRTIQFQSNVNYVASVLNIYGTPGNLMTIKGASAGTPSYLTLVGNLSTAMDYVSIQDIYSTHPYKMYAGANSTDVSGNTNIQFTPPVAGPYLHSETGMSAVNSTTQSITIPYPPPVGAILLFTYANPGTTVTVTPPSGFSLISNTGGTSVTLETYQKISDGTESTLTVTTNVSANAALRIAVITGFTGTPTLDVTDTNNSATSSVSSMSTTATTGPTNTGQPAIAIGVFGYDGGVGTSMNATNNFGIIRPLAEANIVRSISKLLTTLAPVDSTYTWSTTRRAASQLIVYKDVAGAGRVKVKLSGTFVIKPTKAKISGTFVTKPVKVKVGGVFV